jgi:glycosyltransferase involved in cell wall biosynthesis
VHAVNNGVDMDYFHAMPDAPTANIVFVGVLNYKPNSDGVAWFAERVMPGLRERAPQVKFQIIGRHPTARVMELNAIPGVQVVGSVPDTRHYLRDACAVVAPLQIARGVQNKVLEGMSCARAVVCSPEAHEGIDAVDGEHLLVAREPAQWVDTLARIINDGDARRRVATAARDRIVARYSWESCLQPLVDLLMRCRLPGRPPAR